MMPDSAIIQGQNDQRIRLVKGCPCMKEFGDERVCINNDNVVPIKSMQVDPLFFTQLQSISDLDEFKSEREDMCYSLINLDNSDDCVYCISQGSIIRINNKAVSATNIEDALDFTVSPDMNDNEVICSSCLYKYLVTLTDLYEDLLSESEKSLTILSYSKDLVNKIAEELSLYSLYSNRNIILTKEEIIEQHIHCLTQEREKLNRLAIEKESLELQGDFEILVRVHRTLSRLEAVFLFQVLSLNEADDELTALTLLKFMIDTANRILSTHDEIRKQRDLLDRIGILTGDLDALLSEKEEQRVIAERRFRNLIVLLSQVSGRPS